MVAVLVCKRCKGRGRLVAFLRTHTGASLQKVGCQKVCKEPVAGLSVNGRMEWFSCLDGKKALRALAELVAAQGCGELPEALEKRRVAKRSGRAVR